MSPQPSALALVEHVDRELDLVCLARALLKSRHGIDLEVASFYLDAPLILDRPPPRIVFTPFFYSASDWLLKDYVSAWPNARFANLAWEQVFYPSHTAIKAPRGAFALKDVTHLAWSKHFVSYMREHGVQPDQIKLVGHSVYRMYQPPYRDYFPSRQELAERHGLRPDRRWVFVPENYRWAFLSDKKVRKIQGHGVGGEELEQMRGFCHRTIRELITWCNVLASRGNAEVILRPRPAISTDQILEVCQETLGPQKRKFKVIKDGSAREWVMASDVVASSFSTVLIEAAIAGKTVVKIEPEPIPEGLRYDWCDLVAPTRTMTKFLKACETSELGANSAKLRAWAERMFFPTPDPVTALVDAMAELIGAADAESRPPVRGPHGFQMPEWLREAAPAMSPAERRRQFRQAVEGFSFPSRTHEKDMFGRADVEQRTRSWTDALTLTHAEAS